MGRALLIVDYQNDFTPPNGALAVEGGEEIAPVINEEAAKDDYDAVVATRDWHPPHHSSFEERGGPWPVHCVQGTEGAELDPKLDTSNVDWVLDKGQSDETGGYSAFEGDELAAYLRERGIDQVTVTGLAADVCVHDTSVDALEEGFDVEVLSEGTRGVDPENTEKALREIEEKGGKVR